MLSCEWLATLYEALLCACLIWDYMVSYLGGELKPPKSIKSPSLGCPTPPLSHPANGLFDVGLSFSMWNDWEHLGFDKKSLIPTELLTPLTQLASKGQLLRWFVSRGGLLGF